jgi:cation transport regulator ChaC
MFVFVYGSSMNPKYLKEKNVDFINACKAIMNGYNICFSTKTDDWRQAMIDIEEKNYSSVEGVLYEVTDEAMQLFDDLENVSTEEHDKIFVDINVGKGPNVDAYTYICRRKDGHFRPSDKYMDVLVEGAELNGLSSNYIKSLRDFI